MSKQKDRNELNRYGNFIVDAILDKNGHTTHIEVRTSSGNFKFRVDEGTFMFSILKEASTKSDKNPMVKKYHDYIHATIAMIYRFGVSGIPVDFLEELDNLLVKYAERKSKENSHDEKEEKAIIVDMKRDQEMKDELKNNKDGK